MLYILVCLLCFCSFVHSFVTKEIFLYISLDHYPEQHATKQKWTKNKTLAAFFFFQEGSLSKRFSDMQNYYARLPRLKL